MMGALMSFANGEEAGIFRRDLCCNGWCLCRRQHTIGREAQKKIDIIDELVNEGKSFVEVSDSCSTSIAEIINIPADSGNIVYFASRESTRNRVVTALKDERTFSVGIYGMGGIGKTTLKDQVHKQVIEEKLFDVAVTTVVSQNVDLGKIQDDIAKGLDFQKLKEIDDRAKRATLLKERLKQEKSIRVILDDVWGTEQDLFAVIGIPFGKYSGGGCKVLITTRNREVCNSLMLEENIEVGLLSDEESWHLFKKNAGDVVDSPELHKIAREVVNECGRLPLALDTLARALRNNKDKQVWEYIASQLRNSNYAEIEGMGPRVYSSIRFSYNFARNIIIKRCFLLCCLFPEDEEICATDLLIYAMGDDVVRGDLETLMQVKARLHAALYKLASLGLLVRVSELAVKMHDIVRDVAISIASEEGNHFYVKAGLGLKDWPSRGLSSIGKCLRLSLMGNGIHELPTEPQLPHLLSLSLRDNESLEKMPDSFFESMNHLLSLDINGTRISSLPLSITCLANLCSLDMGGCEFYSQLDLTTLGKLKKLEILNLACCGLSSLPEEIGGLSLLKWLDLSGNHGLNMIGSC